MAAKLEALNATVKALDAKMATKDDVKALNATMATKDDVKALNNSIERLQEDIDNSESLGLAYVATITRRSKQKASPVHGALILWNGRLSVATSTHVIMYSPENGTNVSCIFQLGILTWCWPLLGLQVLSSPGFKGNDASFHCLETPIFRVFLFVCLLACLLKFIISPLPNSIGKWVRSYPHTPHPLLPHLIVLAIHHGHHSQDGHRPL